MSQNLRLHCTHFKSKYPSKVAVLPTGPKTNVTFCSIKMLTARLICNEFACNIIDVWMSVSYIGINFFKLNWIIEKNGLYLDSVGSEVSPLSFLEHVVRWVQPAMVLDFFEQWSFPIKKKDYVNSLRPEKNIAENGGLISIFFSLWLQSIKTYQIESLSWTASPKMDSAQDSALALFFGDWSQTENFLTESWIYLIML